LRCLHRAGLVVAQPHKRPRSSYVRFQAEQPNETWQADFTPYRLIVGADVEILCWLSVSSSLCKRPGQMCGLMRSG
jgi:hypothetical protein